MAYQSHRPQNRMHCRLGTWQTRRENIRPPLQQGLSPQELHILHR